jgi:glycosyltransferase involved in cell wall biosynthesis
MILVDKLSNPLLKEIEFIIVDNGSTDSSSEILSRMKLPSNVRMLRVPVNKGYGFGIMAGLKEHKTEFVGWMHADLQTDPVDLALFLKHLNPGVDFLKGKRVGRPASDKFFTSGMSLILSIMFRRKLRDINGQPTIIKRNLVDTWKNPPNDFGLDLFSYIYAINHGVEIMRIKVKFGRRIYGKSSWNSGLISRIRFISRTLSLSNRLRRNVDD